MKYKDWLDIWLTHYIKPTCKIRTYERYRKITEIHILPLLGEIEINDITAVKLQQVVSTMLESGNKRTNGKLSANTVKSIISVLQNSLRTAKNMGYLNDYMADKIHRPKATEKRIECFTSTEQCEYIIADGTKPVFVRSYQRTFELLLKRLTIHTHKYTDTIIPPTCVEKGYTLHACDCGYEYKDNYVNAKHDYVLIEYIAPTCETDGRESYKCIHCGKEKIEIIKATGHTFGNWIEQKKPSCTICGCEARECSVCGKVERRSIAQTGHKFSSWRKEGSDYVRDCHNCGFEQKIGFPVEEEGQIIEFGRFLQKDGSMSPIKWIVLKIDNNKKRALVFSLVTIAERMYNKTILRNTAFLDENDASEKLAWKNSDIRIWLNNDFFNFAFTASEKSIILESQNHNHIYKTNEYRSKEYEVVSVKEGPITTDNVFLLSISEIETCFHWSFKRRQLPNSLSETVANFEITIEILLSRSNDLIALLIADFSSNFFLIPNSRL